MTANSIVSVVVIGLFVPALLTAQTIEVQAKRHHYKPIDVGTLGGASSYLNALFDGPFFNSAKVLNQDGTFAGWADTPAHDPFPAFCFNLDCYVCHALQWHGASSTDLGSLADGWSSAATWINNRGEIFGLSQNDALDPSIGFPEEPGVLWCEGQMIDLGTLGGNQSAAFSINSQGQIAGLASNTTPDPLSIYDALFYGSANGTQTRAERWERDGRVQDLGTLGGPDSHALFVNDRGQVVGWSYTNSTINVTLAFPPFHPFVWERGKGMEDLRTLGGTVPQAVNAMNQHGQVVGATTMAGDQAQHPSLWGGKRLIDLGTSGGDNGEAARLNETGKVVGLAQPTTCPLGSNAGGGHAFLWRHGVLHDLGTTVGLDNSEADYINSTGQVVGYSFHCELSAFDPFLWENGTIVDLNILIPSNSPFHLWAAEFIADNGEIAPLGLLPEGDRHVVLLIPCDENHPGIEGCDYRMVNADVPPSIRSPVSTALRELAPGPARRSHRFHFPTFGDTNRSYE